MPALPPTDRPRHAAPSTFGPEATQSILTDSRMLDEVGRGAYTGDDPAGRFLADFRALKQRLSEEPLPPASQPTERVDPLQRLALYLAGAAALAVVAGVAVAVFVSAPLGLMLLAMAVSWAGVTMAIVRQTGWPR